MVGQAGQPFPLSKGALLISCWKICDMRTKKVSRNRKRYRFRYRYICNNYTGPARRFPLKSYLEEAGILIVSDFSNDAIQLAFMYVKKISQPLASR